MIIPARDIPDTVLDALIRAAPLAPHNPDDGKARQVLFAPSREGWRQALAVAVAAWENRHREDDDE